MDFREVDIVGNTFEFLRECKQNGEVLRKQAPPSIYMVPSLVRDLSPSSFTPRVVAIGPLHSQDEHLQKFEVQKKAYLYNLVHRVGFDDPDHTLRQCAEEVIRSIERIKACYAGSTTYNDFELAKMMVLDACFILEFLESLSDLSSEANLWNVSSETNLLNATNILINRSISHDLLLIENQIPFFVLETIYKCTILASGRGASLTTCIEVLVKRYNLFQSNLVTPPASTPDHILGFVHKYFQPVDVQPESTSTRKGHSAMELYSAGMKFKPNNENPDWAMSMKLEANLPLFPWLNIFTPIPPFSWFLQPTLRMPKVRLGDYSELILRNLIAYEQISGVKKYVTSYVCAMDMLIDAPEDVALLVKSKVLISYFGSNEEAADMINNLCKNIEFLDFFYGQQWKEMDAYYSSYWPNTVALLKHKYFSNPWSVIALIAAFLLFVLTITQTIFTIRGPVNK